MACARSVIDAQTYIRLLPSATEAPAPESAGSARRFETFPVRDAQLKGGAVALGDGRSVCGDRGFVTRLLKTLGGRIGAASLTNPCAD